MRLYPTTDRIGCIYPIKFEFCFSISIFFKNDYMQLEVSVTPKIHAVFYHIQESCDLTGSGLGHWNEHRSELHQEFHKYWEKYLAKY